MKRKLLIGLLALTGGVAVVGSGFSAWYFGETSLPDSTKGVNVYVTDMADGIGTLTNNDSSKSLYIVLDQGTYTNKTDITKGISVNSVEGAISDTNVGSALNELSATYSITATEAKALVANGITSGTFKASLKLSSTASTYIGFKTSYTGITPTAETGKLSVSVDTISYEYTIDYSKVSSDLTQDFKIDVSTKEYVNSLLQYNKDKKPTDKTSYEAMKNAIANATDDPLTITYSFAANL